MLDSKKRGKGNVQVKFIAYLSKHSNPLTNGRSSTPETVNNWIKAGLELAESEAARRADGGAAGRAVPNVQVPKPQWVWYELVQYYAEWQREQPTTSRYTTPPAHLKGKVQLKFDDLPSLPNGREEKAAGVELREQAVSKVAAERDVKRKDIPESKEHLHPRRIKTEPASETDGFMQMFMTAEVDRGRFEAQRIKQEILSAKTEQLNKFVNMLANPALPEQSKAIIASLLNTAAMELAAMGADGAVSGAAVAGGPSAAAAGVSGAAAAGASDEAGSASASASASPFASPEKSSGAPLGN